MFKINRKIEYALMALKHISQKDSKGLTSAKEICDAHQIPFDPTSRVLQLMAQKGIVKAELGVNGGYILTKDLAKIWFIDLVETIVGPVQVVECSHSGEDQCDLAKGCNVISPMLNLNDRIRAVFESVSVDELLASRHPREKLIKSKALSLSKTKEV